VAKKLVQAEFTSTAGTSSPSSAATVQASAGDIMSGWLEPAITIPMSSSSSPARSRAIRAARAPVRAWVHSATSRPSTGSRFPVSRM